MGSKGQNIFSEEGYVIYHIMQLKRLTLCTPDLFLLGKKGSDIELVQISII